MSKPRERLINQVNKLNEGQITDDSVSALMSFLRQYADETGNKSCSVLRLYSNWFVHHELDRLDARKVLTEIQALLETGLSRDGQLTAQAIVEAINPRTLITQMSGLIMTAGGAANFLQAEKARLKFLRVLFEAITHKPLRLSESEIEAQSRGNSRVVVKSLVLLSTEAPDMFLITIDPILKDRPDLNGMVGIQAEMKVT
jgi:hypothetical protein